MTLSEKLTSAPHAETDLGMLFNHSLISSHEIAGEIFWPVTQGIWSPQLPLENISDCMVPITEMCFLTVQEAGKVKGQRVLVLVESDEAHSGISEALGELG